MAAEATKYARYFCKEVEFFKVSTFMYLTLYLQTLTALLTKIRGFWGITSCLLVINEELTRWYIPGSSEVGYK
jgi:hypothetical protein